MQPAGSGKLHLTAVGRKRIVVVVFAAVSINLRTILRQEQGLEFITRC